MPKRVTAFTLRKWTNTEKTWESAPVVVSPQLHADLGEAVRELFEQVYIGTPDDEGRFIVGKKIGYYFTLQERVALHNFCLGFLAGRGAL